MCFLFLESLYRRTDGSGFPFDYLFWNLVLAFSIIYLFRILKHNIGAIVSFLANLVLGRQSEIKVGGIVLALLGGKISLQDLVYTTQNFQIRLSQGTIQFQWWVKRVRQPSDPTARQLPFRLSLHLVGLEIVVMGNGAKIEAIEDLLGINVSRSKRGYANKVAKSSRSSRSPRARDPFREAFRRLPFFYQVVPVMSITAEQICFYAASPSLPTMLILHAKDASAIHYAKKLIKILPTGATISILWRGALT